MAFQVYDYRKDNRNLLVTPEIRARFEYMKVGQIDKHPDQIGHSHDMGHEVFLVMQGQIEFNIGDDTQVLGPGEFCVARTDEVHYTRNVGDDVAILYLSVTPHIQPTHTGWIDEETRTPLRFNASTNYNVPADQTTPNAELADVYLAQADALAETTKASMDAQDELVCVLKGALAAGDEEGMTKARADIWGKLQPMFQQMFALGEAWNNLTYRTADGDFWKEEAK